MAASELIIEGLRYVPSKVAASTAGIVPDYITKLARQGFVRGIRKDGIWYVDENSLHAFLKLNEARKRELFEKQAQERRQELHTSEMRSIEERIEVSVPRIHVAPSSLRAITHAHHKQQAHRRARAQQHLAIASVGSILFLGSLGIAFSGVISVSNIKGSVASVAFGGAVAERILSFFDSLVPEEPYIPPAWEKTIVQDKVITPMQVATKPAPVAAAPIVQTTQPVTPLESQRPLTGQVERIQTVYHGGISEQLLESRLATLEAFLSGRIDSVQYEGIRQSADLGEDIAGIGGAGFDDIDITDSTWTGGSITNASISGGSLSGTTLSLSGDATLENFSATNGTTTNATSTNLYVSGSFGFGSGTGILQNTAGTVSTLSNGSNGQVLKIVGGTLSWSTDLSGGAGGSGAWATTSDDLAIYPADTTDVVLVGNSATTTTGNILEVAGNSLFRNAVTSYGLLTASRFTATSSVASVFPYASTTALSATTLCLTGDTCRTSWPTDGFSTTSSDYWKTQRNFFSTTSSDYWKTVNNFFSTTSADYWETQQTARTADDLTNNSIEDLNDVAAITENYGDLLFWNGSSWADIATSTLGLLTTNVAESSNLYYTDSRVQTYLDGVNKGFFFSTTSTDYWKTINNFFSTTSADAWKDQRNFFSTTSAIHFVDASTTIPKTYSSNIFTGANTFNGAFTLGSLNGPLHANNGLVSATTSILAIYGGTGQTSYSVGDILYASGAGTLTKLGIGGSGTVLKVSGGVPTWGTDLTSGGGGGATAWATTSDSLAIHPADTSDVLIIGASATTTASSILEVFGRSYFSNNVGIGTTSPGARLSVEGSSLLGNSATAGYFVATTSAASQFPYASTTMITAATASSTNAFISSIFSGSLLKTTTGGQVIAAVAGTDYIANTSGDWTGTFDGREGSYYLANSFSTTSADAWKDTRNFFSTTSSDYWKTVNNFFSTTSSDFWKSVNNFFSTTSADYWETQQTARTADDLTNNSIEDLNDVAVMTENYGDLLGWNGSSWTDFATSSLGISLADTTGTLAVSRGGTGASTFSYGLVLSPGGTSALTNIATSSLGLLTTHVAEGSNLYFTDARVQTYLDSVAKGFFFSTTSADAWKDQRNFFSTTSADYYVHSSTTIPKTYTANTFTALQTIPYASSTAITVSGTASTTNLVVSSAGGTAGCATFSSNGTLSNTGVACGTGSGGADFTFQSHFGALTAATSSPTFFSGNLFASSTVRFGAANGTQFLFDSSLGRLGIGTTSPFATLSIQATTTQTNPLFEVASTSNATKFLSVAADGFGTTTLAGLNINGSATSTSNVGFNLSAGCFAISGTCVGGGSGSGTVSSGTTGQLPYYAADGTTLTATSSLFLSTAGNVGIGTTTPRGKLSLYSSTTAASITGLEQFHNFNISGGGTSFANYIDITNAPIGSANTLVGSIMRLRDNTSLANTVRGLEIQTNQGSNTQGENTALSTFARTFGVRAVTEGDAGGVFLPAALYAETRGTTQGNAIRAYSSSITSADALVSILHDTSAFTGTGLLMNLADGSGSATGSLLDLQANDVSRLIVKATGNVGIGTTTPQHMLTIASSTAPQLSLSAGAGINQWAFRNAGGNLYFATTTVAGTATTSTAALSISGSGFGTTTIRGLDIIGQATSTSNVGFNLSAGCFAISGTCVGNDGTFSTTSADFWKDQRNFFSTTSSDYWKTVNNFFSTTSADFWKTVNNFFSTTSADYYVHSSTTIPKTYTDNTFTGGNLFLASTTIGNGTQTGGLTISGGATTTGFLKVLSTATSTFSGGLQTTALNVTSSSASSTFANGIQLSAGCFRGIDNTCITNTDTSTLVSGAGSGSANRVAYWSSASAITSSANLTFDGTTLTARDLLVQHTSPILSLNDSDTSGTDFRLDVADGSATFSVDISAALSNEFFAWNTNNNEKMRLTEGGNLGLGTSTPTHQLTIASSTAPQLSLSAGAGIAQWAFRNAGGNLYFASTTVAGTATSSLNALMINSDGAVGIGTKETSFAALEVRGSSGSADGELYLTNNGFSVFSSGSVTAFGHGATTGNTYSTINSYVDGGFSSGNLALQNAGGNVGIGTTTPQYKLSLYDAASSQLSLSAGAGIAQWAFRNAGGNLYFASTTVAGTATTSTSALTIIGSTGQVGIGPSDFTQGFKFNVDGTGSVDALIRSSTSGSQNAAGLWLDRGDTANGSAGLTFGTGLTSDWNFNMPTGSSDLRWYASSTGEVMRLTRGGRLGIGTTTPGSALSIQGNIFLAGNIVSTSTATSTFAGGLQTTALNVTSTVATSTFANGLNLSAGCIAINNSCIGGSSLSGTQGQVAFFSGTDTAVGTSTLTIATNSKVGIGTTTPQYKLSLYDAASSQLSLSAGAGIAQWAFRNAGGDFFLSTTTIAGTATSTLSAFTVSSATGNVGVSTSSPNAKFAVQGSGTGTGSIFQLVNSAFTKLVEILDNGTAYFLGNLGVGTTTPWRKLSVTDTVSNPQVAIAYDATRYASFQVDSTGDLTFDAQGGDIFATDENFFACSSGCAAGNPTGTGNVLAENKIGVGTTTPGSKLTIETQDGTTDFMQVASTTAQSIFTIKANGKVGVATSSPWAKFSIGAGGALVVAENDLTDGATVAIDWLQGNQQRVVLGGNRSITFANYIAGQGLRVIVCQDSTGSRTVSWPAGILWNDGTAPTLTTTANKCDMVSFIATDATSTLKVFGSAVLNF